MSDTVNGSDSDSHPLSSSETWDADQLGDELDGPGYSPPDRRSSELSWGFTAREAGGHEPLAARLARERPDEEPDEPTGDGIGDIVGTDGEAIDDQVGSVRAGRLIFSEPDSADPASDYWSTDVGIDQGGASAEEAAVHVVLEDEDQ